jgi:hypothetical protein
VKTQEVQLFLMQHLFGHDIPDGTTSSFQSNNDAKRKGWAEIKQYDHKNNAWVTHTFWTHFTVTGSTEFGDNHVQVTVDLPVIYSALNLTEAAV